MKKIVFILMLFLSCKSSHTHISKFSIENYCNDWFEEVIRKNWLKNGKLRVFHDKLPEIRCYEGTKIYWEQAIIWNKICLIGKSKSYIESYLGQPSSEWKYEDESIGVRYSISDSEEYPVWHIQIIYSLKLIVIDVDEAVTFVD